MKIQVRLLTTATLASTLFIAGAASAAAVSIIAPQTTAQDATANSVTYSADGSTTFAGSATFVTNTTGATSEVTVGNTTAAKEISATGVLGIGFDVQATNPGAGLVNFTVASGAVVEGGLHGVNNAPGAATGLTTIVNSGTIRQTGAAAGSAVTLAGAAVAQPRTLINKTGGLIDGTATNAIAGINSVQTANNAQITTIINEAGATIQGNKGIQINEAAASGAISLLNSGTINGTVGEGFYYNAHITNAHTFNNMAGATISSTSADAFRMGTTASTSTIANSGTITANAAGMSGMKLEASVTAINNNGGIIESKGTTANSYGVNLVAGTTAALTNVGTIRANSGTGIITSAAVVGFTGITNGGAAAGTISGGVRAIDLTLQTTAVNLTNNSNGTITGDVALPAVLSTVNVNGGTISGAIIGAAAANILNVNGSFTTGGAMSNMQNITVANPGTVFQVGHALTAVNAALNVNAGAKLFVRDGGSIVSTGAVGVGQTSTGVWSFQLGKGVDTTATAGTTSSTAGTTTSGFINLNGSAFNPNNSPIEISQSGSGYIGNLARFYVIRSNAAVAAPVVGTFAFLGTSTANTPLVTFTAKQDTAGLYMEAARTAPAAVAFGKSNTLTEKSSRPVLAAMDSLAGNATALATLNKAFGAIQVLSTGTAIADETARLAPQVNGSATRSASVTSQGVIGNTTMQRLASLRDGDVSNRTSYAAGDEHAAPEAAKPAHHAHHGHHHYHGHSKHAMWGQMVGNKSNQNNRDGVIGYNARTIGFAIGGDMLVNSNFVAGLAAGYGKTGVNSQHAISDRNDINSWSGIAYGSYGIDANWYVDGSANYTRHRYYGRRNITSLSDIAYSKYYGNQYGARVMSGKHYHRHAWQITPMAGVRVSNLDLNTYTETGGATTPVLRVDSKNLVETMLSAGARFRFHHNVRGGHVLPEFHGMLNYDFSAKPHKAGSQFVVGGLPVGSVFTTEGAREAKFSWNAGAGLTLSADRHWHATVQYDYTGKVGFNAHAGMMNLRYTW